MQVLREEVLVFSEVIRAGSMSAAAEALNIQQPAVSKAIKKLEAECGERLVTRGREGSRPTLAGRKLLEKLTLLEGRSAPASSAPTQLVLGCHPSIAIDQFPKILRKLRSLFPQTELRFVFAPSTEITAKVVTGEVDLGFVINPIKRRQLIAKGIKKDYVALWGGTHKKEGAPILIHPDMLYAPHVKKQFSQELWPMPDYEVIAQLCRHDFQGVLPAVVAARHGLGQLSKKLFEVELKLITHEDRFQKPILRQIYSVLE